jgi:hypothetical protein
VVIKLGYTFYHEGLLGGQILSHAMGARVVCEENGEQQQF